MQVISDVDHPRPDLCTIAPAISTILPSPVLTGLHACPHLQKKCLQVDI